MASYTSSLRPHTLVAYGLIHHRSFPTLVVGAGLLKRAGDEAHFPQLASQKVFVCWGAGPRLQPVEED